MTTLYNARSADGSIRITKFDVDLNPVPDASYLTSREACECPAGVRPMCRHRHMLEHFLTEDAVDQPVFYCYETGAWHGPEGQLLTPELPELPPLPEGVEIVGFDDMATLHNTIAEAVGEPSLATQVTPPVTPTPRPVSLTLRRRQLI